MTLKKAINYGIMVIIFLGLIASMVLYIAGYYNYGHIVIGSVDCLLIVHIIARLIYQNKLDKKLKMLMKSMEDDYRDITKSFDDN